ncbi:MAG TPA: PEP-CTERM sorting domain-containing protein [Pirellulales bacterium]|nr:PEP-CTERM sorting domain-containing protein [Pirellulales bacterium]
MTVAAARQAQAAWIVVDSINESATPAFYSPGGPAIFTWAASDVGWFYTPSSSYDLWQIATKFAWADNRNVTVDIYQASLGPGGELLSPALGETPLRSAEFTPQTDAFAGGIFTPLQLTANDTYFFDFKNVQGLGVNVTADSGATSLPGGLRFGFSNDGPLWAAPAPNFLSQPIVQFLVDPPVGTTPEPSSLVLFGIGGCITGAGAALRRRREKRAAV